MRNIKGYTDHILESYGYSDVKLGPITPEDGSPSKLTREQKEYRNLVINSIEDKIDGKTIDGWLIVAGGPTGYYEEDPQYRTFNTGDNVPMAKEGDDIFVFAPFFSDNDWFVTFVGKFYEEINRDLEYTDFCALDIWQYMTGDVEEDSDFIIDMIRDIMPKITEKAKKRKRSIGAFGRF